jgi:hypothetical protein
MQVFAGAPGGCSHETLFVWTAEEHSVVDRQPSHTHRPPVHAKWEASLSELWLLWGTQSDACWQAGMQDRTSAPGAFWQTKWPPFCSALHSLAELQPFHAHRPDVQAKWLGS